MADTGKGMDTLIDALLREAERFRQEFERTTIRCGMVGLSGSGKSSLINAIAGERIAPVGSTEQTMAPQEFVTGGTTFVDLPGCGTQRWPQDSYIKCLDLRTYDCFVIVTSTRLYESDLFLWRELHVRLEKPCFIVRNKIDLAVHDEYIDNQLSEEATLAKVRTNLMQDIHPPPERVYLTSARHPTRFDLPLLVSDIIDSQGGVKRDRLLADLAAWSQDAIAKKRSVAHKVVSWSAVAAAANGLNPIPGVNVAVDVGILTNMARQVAKIYGVTTEQLSDAERTVPGLAGRAVVRGAQQAVARFAARFIAAKGVLVVLKRMGAKVAVKNVARFLPFVGHLIAAGIGYKMTTAFGEQVIEEAEDVAHEILEATARHEAEG